MTPSATTPRIAVVGAGGIGGVIAWSLAKAGLSPTLIARGESAHTIARDGLTVERTGPMVPAGEPMPGPESVRLAVVEDTAQAGPQDIVIGTMKAQDWPGAVETLKPLLGPDTLVVPALNGLPWWYLAEGAQGGRCSVDPAGVLTAGLRLDNVVGCVVYMGALRTSPGTIRWSSGRKLVLGAAVGRSDGRLTALVTLLRSAGLDIVEASDIRKEVWVKLLGNAVFNPLSVVARATMEEMIEDTDLRSICIAAMAEAIAVAAASGVALNVTPEDRLAMNAHMGPFKSSTLQDFEAGRPLEIAALVDAPCEIGARHGIATPVLATLGRLARVASARQRRMAREH